MSILNFFLPTHYFTYQTKQQVEKVKLNLKNSFNPVPEILSRLSSNKTKYYEGQVWENQFIITRKNDGNPTIFPIAQGIIKQNENGCEIISNIKQTQNVQRITLFSFILFVIAMLSAFIFKLILLESKIINVTILFGGFPLFLFLLYYFVSKYRAKKLEKDIIEIIEGKNK